MVTATFTDRPASARAERDNAGLVAYCAVCGVHVVTTVGAYDKGIYCRRDRSDMFACLWLCPLDRIDNHRPGAEPF